MDSHNQLTKQVDGIRIIGSDTFVFLAAKASEFWDEWLTPLVNTIVTRQKHGRRKGLAVRLRKVRT